MLGTTLHKSPRAASPQHPTCAANAQPAARTWLMRRAMVAMSSFLVGSFSSFFTSR